MADLEISALNRRRSNIKGQVTKFISYLNDINSDFSVTTVTTKLEQFNRLLLKFEQLKTDYYSVAKEEEFEAIETTLSAIDTELDTIEVGIKSLLHVNNSASNKIVESKPNTSHYKLPEIALPKFSGHFEDWFAFKNQFVSLIDSNIQLGDQEKLFYLQSSLLGISKQIQTQDDTYESLMKALIDRFENKRLIINSHINALLTKEKIKQDSSKDLRQLVDKTIKHLRSLKLLELVPNKLTEILLIHLMEEKLDNETRKEFEKSLNDTEAPTLTQFLDFLSKKCQIQETIDATLRNSKPLQNNQRVFVTRPNNEQFCNLCEKSSHNFVDCYKFKRMDSKTRFDTVKSLKLCLLCFDSSHRVNTCKSRYCCDICKKNHNTLLHFNSQSDGHNSSPVQTSEVEELPQNNSDCVESVVTASSFLSSTSKTVLLTTAIVYINDSRGIKIPCRALIDNGSQSHYLTTSCVQMLRLSTQKTNVSISTLNGTKSVVKSKATATISNSSGDYQRSLDFLVVPKITELCPARCLNISNLKIPTNIDFADPQWFEPSKIDVLLGAEIFFELLKLNKVTAQNSELHFQDTVFGYIANGSVNNHSNENEVYCGLQRNEDFLSEYRDLGHMSEVNGTEPHTTYFVPHHSVLRPDAQSTELRVVFNASAITNAGTDTLYLKMFVANRVVTIQELSSANQCHHVPIADNPSGLISKNLDLEKILGNELQLNGPDFLLNEDILCEDVTVLHHPDCALKRSNTQPEKCLLNRTMTVNPIIEQLLEFYFQDYSEFQAPQGKGTGNLLAAELQSAERTLVPQCRKQDFQKEMIDLEVMESEVRRSKLQSLHPFINNDSLLYSNLNFNKKYPMVIFSNYKLTTLIVNNHH